MQIGSLAKANGVSVQTVRYYERYGLLPKPQRKASSYRIYTDEHVRRLQFVLQAKTLGFTLDEIKEIISLSQRHECPCGRVVRIAEPATARVYGVFRAMHDGSGRLIPADKKQMGRELVIPPADCGEAQDGQIAQKNGSAAALASAQLVSRI